MRWERMKNNEREAMLISDRHVVVGYEEQE
jgi:hypothetical protein